MYCDAGEDDRHEKDVVRGYTFAEYHADVYDKTESEVTGAGLDCECLGGGRIEHRPGDKFIKVARIIQFSGLITNSSRCMVTAWALEKPIMPELWKYCRKSTKTIKSSGLMRDINPVK